MMHNVAVVLAGGVGRRLSHDIPKQFLQVEGKMVIEYTINAFESHAQINEIAVVSHPSYIEEVERIVQRNGWKKVRKILQGGRERYDSTLAAIHAYKDSEERHCDEKVNLIFHDAARPFVSERIITQVCEALVSYQAVNVLLPVVDTIVEVETSPTDHHEHIVATPKRSHLRRVQTPQAFRLPVIAEAYRRALHDATFHATDDCGIVFNYLPEVDICIVQGEERNMKLTYRDDIFLLEKFLQEGAS